ncbi:MAG: 3-keto-disaccharide hydrolase [Janthinobacterium lividum]
MKKLTNLLSASIFLLITTSFQPQKEWTNLLDKNLSKWDIYQSYRHKVGYKGEILLDKNSMPVPPIGTNKNEANVFSVVMQNGEPVLRISGEIYGCIYTKQDFENYDLKLKVKWGNKKWVPRLNEPMDSGILYNSQGKPGVDYWHSWMLSQEFQVSQHETGNSMGDYWCIANSQADVRIDYSPKKDSLKFDPKGELITTGSGKNFVQASGNYESPQGQWNELELISFGGKSLHIVNGHVVMALSNSSYKDGDQRKPLTHGKIQLQSEAAELFYKDIMIQQISAIPAKYAAYFD